MLRAAVFGRVDIDGASGAMTVALKDIADDILWSVDIEPKLMPDSMRKAALDKAI